MRRRSRRRILVPALITVVILVSWWVSSLSQDNLDSAGFVQELQSVADGQATRAERFRQLYVDASVALVERESLAVTLDQAIAEVEVDLELVRNLDDLPSEAHPAYLLMELALGRWRSGLIGFKDAALRLPDSADASARLDLQSAIVDLEVGDALYAEFQQTVADLRTGIGVQGAPFPDVVFIDPAMAFSESVGVLVERLRDNPAMASEQVVEIATVRFDPDFTGASGGDGAPLLPNTESVTIEVVVRNAGTDIEESLSLEMRLLAGSVEVTREVLSVSAVNPAGSTALQLGPIEVDDRVTYTLELSLLQSAGITIASYAQDFIVNPPAS